MGTSKSASKIQQHTQAGFSLIEVLIIVTIIGILAVVVITNFSDNRQTVLLKTTTQSIASEITRVHSDALAGKGNDDQSIRFASTTYERFGSDTYDPDASDIVLFEIDPSLLISTTLSSDGVLTFYRLTGEANETATITVAVADDLSKYEQIRIGPRGDVTLIGE